MTTDRRAHDPFAPHPRLVSVPKPLEPEATKPDLPTGTALEEMAKPDLVNLAILYKVAVYGSKADIASRIRAARR